MVGCYNMMGGHSGSFRGNSGVEWWYRLQVVQALCGS